MQFVPESEQRSPAPCRYIPLNLDGETVDSLYRTGTRPELEHTVRHWLAATISRLEEALVA